MQIVEEYNKLISEVKDISFLISKNTAEEPSETIGDRNGKHILIEKEIEKIKIKIHEMDEIVGQTTSKLNALKELSNIIEKIKKDAQKEKMELISKNDVFVNELIEIERIKKEEQIKLLKQQIKEVEGSYEKKREQLSEMKQRYKSDDGIIKKQFVLSLSILLSKQENK